MLFCKSRDFLRSYPLFLSCIPLIAQGIDLVGKFGQILIRAALIFADDCQKSLSCCHEPYKYIGNSPCFLLDGNWLRFVFQGSSERAGILRHCKENGITFYSYMVLEQGALTGKFDLDHPFPEGSSRAKTYNGMLTEIETLIAEMRHIGERHSASPAQIAIAWARSKGTLPIIGVTKVSQAEEAAKTAEIVLADEEISAVEELAERTGVSTLRGWEREM